MGAAAGRRQRRRERPARSSPDRARPRFGPFHSARRPREPSRVRRLARRQGRDRGVLRRPRLPSRVGRRRWAHRSRPLRDGADRAGAGGRASSGPSSPAAQARRAARPGSDRRRGGRRRRGRRRLCRAGERISPFAPARFADLFDRACSRRSGRGAGRDGRRVRSGRAARRLQSAAEGLSRAARGADEHGGGSRRRRPDGRRGGRNRRRRRRLGRLRRRRRPAFRRSRPARPHEGPRLSRLRRGRPPARPGRPRTRRPSRQYGDVALGAARHGRTANRGQHSRLLRLGHGRRYGPDEQPRRGGQAGHADAGVFRPDALRADQSVVGGSRIRSSRRRSCRASITLPASATR